MAISLILIHLLCCKLGFASAANNTIVTGWVDDPSNQRGTFSILSSCILTLVLCVYTAMHTNVKELGKTDSQAWMTTSKWVVVGVLAPELLCFVAWRQWVSAKSITRTVKEMKGKDCRVVDATDEAGRTLEPSEMEWSAIHSQYANMGGFVIDLDNAYMQQNSRFTSKADRLTLTPRGVRLLIECGYFPKISKEEILDKSKADNLAKILSLLQATWQMIQIIARVRSGLQVTLLELNTMAHVLCAFVVYALWWQKPKDVSEPTRLRGNWVGPLAAFMFMNSQISGWRARQPGILKKTWIEPEFSILAVKPHSTASKTRQGPSTEHIRPPETAKTSNCLSHEAYELDNLTLITSITPRPLADLRKASRDDTDTLRLINSRLQASADFRTERWRLASEAIQSHEPVAAQFSDRSKVPEHRNGSEEISLLTYLEPNCHEFVKLSIGNWPDDCLLRDGVSGFAIGAVLWSLSMCYGGLHAAAWNEYFPSIFEQYTWRISCLWIAGSGLVWVSINLMARLSKPFNHFWEQIEKLKAHWILVGLLGALAIVCGSGYLLARAFLVIEAFVSLRSMPQAAFDTPKWPQIIPHL